MKKFKITFTKLFFLGLLVLSLSTFLIGTQSYKTIASDGIGYYIYLPSIFINHNLTFKEFKSSGGVIEQKNADKYVDKYPVGTAIMESPFWLAGRGVNLLFGQEREKDNAFNNIYEIAIGISAITYFLLGVFILKKILSMYFSDQIVFITLLVIIFGTNLFNYAVFEGSFSHIYSFFLINLFVYLCIKLKEKKNLKYALLLGINFGFIILVRPVNVLVLIIPFVLFAQELRNNVRNLNYKKVLKFLVIFTLSSAIIFLPQILYWKYSTGNFINFSYPNEGFNLLKPELANLLFSIRKGLFFWSPVLIFSIAGFWLLPEKLKKLRNSFVVYLVIIIFVNASWWYWSFGGSFGQREFVDSLIIFSIPLAAFVEFIILKSRGYSARIFIYLIMLLCFLNICLNIQYYRRNIPNDLATIQDIMKSLQKFTIG